METRDTGESAHLSSFAALLRQYRLEAGLTQEVLAERARLSRGAVSTLERGERQAPRKATVALLAAALGLADEERAALLAAARPRRSRPVPPAPAAPPAAFVAPPDPPTLVPHAFYLPAPPTPLLAPPDSS